MKKLLSVLLVFILFITTTREARGRFVCFPNWEANETSPCFSPVRVVELKYEFEGGLLQKVETDKGFRLVYPGCEDYYFPGAPRIPYLSILIDLAGNEVISTVHITNLQTEKYTLDTSRIDKFDSLKATNGEMTPPEIYRLPDRFPPKPLTYMTSGSLESREGKISIFPFYLQNHQLFLNTHISLTIEINTLNKGPIQKETRDHAIIITPDELEEQAISLSQIQRIEGYQVEVMTLSRIQKDYEMAELLSFSSISFFEDVPLDMSSRFSAYDSETARKIRTFLGNRQKENRVDYVTLLGDATYCPPSAYVFSLNNPDQYDRAIPSDFFYMTPLPEYDDYTLQLKVGRIPVRSVEEAKRFVEKQRRYRKVIRKSWFHSITLFGGDLFEDDYYGEIQSNYMITQGDFNGQTVSKKYQSSGLYRRESILSTLRSGSNGFISMSSHGRGDYLRLPQGYVDSADIYALPKQDRLPIFVSDSCLNGSWDTRLSGIRYGTDSKLPFPTSFAQALVLSEGGAIAYVGGARINYAGMDYDYTDGLVQGHQLYNTDALLHRVFASYTSQECSLGEMTLLGLSDFIQNDLDYPGDWMLKAVFGFCLLGDPTTRLPGKDKVDPPTLTVTRYPDLQKSSVYGLPNLCLNQTNEFELKSSDTELTVSVCDYETWEQPLIQQRTIKPNSGGLYTFTLPSLPKTRLCIRIEGSQGYELRYVFNTRYNQDIRLIPPETFKHMTIGQKVEIPFYVVNDGLDKALDIKVKAMVGETILYEKTIPKLESREVYSLTMDLSFQELGHYPIEFTISPLNDETFTADNHSSPTYIVSSESVKKIGVFQYKYDSSGSHLAGKIWMDQINQSFTDQKKLLEVGWIPKNQIENVDNLGLDLLVLYDTTYFENETSFVKLLESYTQNGGKVLVVGPTSSRVRSLLGFKTNKDYSIHQGDSSFQPFTIDPSFQSLFSQDTVFLPIFEAVAPIKKPLEDILKKEGVLIGRSNDNLLYLTSYHNFYYYSGYLSKLDFERSSSAFTFFVDLLGFPLRNEIPQYVSVFHEYALPVPV